MARRKTTVEEIEEVDDIETIDEVEEAEELDDEVDDEAEGMTAKAFAKALGTDGRTARKFLRSKFGKIGQGKRWNINPDDLESLKAEFAEGARRAPSKKKAAPPTDEGIEEIEELENDELDDISDIEDLADLEFDEFDDELDD